MLLTFTIDHWELECCGPDLHRGDPFDVTLSAWRQPELAQLLGYPTYPDVSTRPAELEPGQSGWIGTAARLTICFPEPPPVERDRWNWVLSGSRHGANSASDQRPLTTTGTIVELADLSACWSADPADPSGRQLVLRPGSYRTTRVESYRAHHALHQTTAVWVGARETTGAVVTLELDAAPSRPAREVGTRPVP